MFLPLLTEHHRWSDRQKVITVPLFPGYAFVLVDQSRDAWQTVLRTVGMIRFVSFGGIVVAAPRKQIEHLQLLLQQKRTLLSASVRTYRAKGADPGRVPPRFGRNNCA